MAAQNRHFQQIGLLFTVGLNKQEANKRPSKMNVNEISELVPGVPKGLEIGLRNYWYPIVQSEELGQGKPIGIQCLGENLVVWRDDRGFPAVLSDRCPHRSAKLSL